MPAQSFDFPTWDNPVSCLLYTSDAADERSSVDLGGRRILNTQQRDDNSEDWVQTINTTNMQKAD